MTTDQRPITDPTQLDPAQPARDRHDRPWRYDDQADTWRLGPIASSAELLLHVHGPITQPATAGPTLDPTPAERVQQLPADTHPAGRATLTALADLQHLVPRLMSERDEHRRTAAAALDHAERLAGQRDQARRAYAAARDGATSHARMVDRAQSDWNDLRAQVEQLTEERDQAKRDHHQAFRRADQNGERATELAGLNAALEHDLEAVRNHRQALRERVDQLTADRDDARRLRDGAYATLERVTGERDALRESLHATRAALTDIGWPTDRRDPVDIARAALATTPPAEPASEPTDP